MSYNYKRNYVFFFIISIIHISSNLNIGIVLKWYVYFRQISVSKMVDGIDQP